MRENYRSLLHISLESTWRKI